MDTVLSHKSRNVRHVLKLAAVMLAFIMLTQESVRLYAEQSSAPPTQTQTQHAPDSPKFWAALLAVVAICGIAAVGIYVIITLSKLFPPPTGTTPPPPPTPVPTNAPPILTNVPPPFPASLQQHQTQDGPTFPPLPPPCTNCPPPRTNSVPVTNAAPPKYWLPYDWMRLAPKTNYVTLTDPDVTAWDVSGFNYMETNSGVPALVHAYIKAPVTNLLSSPDLQTWSNYTLEFWVSGQGTISLLRDGGGAPVITNYSLGNGNNTTNVVPTAIWVRPEGQQFHRLLP